MPLQNRTPTHQEKGHQFAHTTATTAKVPVLINALVVIPENSAAANAVNAFWFELQLSGIAKNTGEIWAFGDKLYWDDVNKRLTKTSTANTLCARALDAAAAADVVSGLVYFNSFA